MMLAAVLLLAGCGRGSADGRIESELRRGIEQIETTRDRHRLDAALVAVVARLRAEHGETAREERGRRLALAGFTLTSNGVRSLIDFDEHDSGEVAAATRDARRADRYLSAGADRLRAAGRALGIPLGAIAGR